MIEGGVPGYDVSSWFGLFVPAKTPKEIVSKVDAEVVSILKMPKIGEKLLGLGAGPVFKTPDQANKYFHNEIDRWTKVVKASGARAD